MDSRNEALRALPQVQRLLEGEGAMALAARHGRGALVSALRGALEEARVEIAEGGAGVGAEDLLARAEAVLAARGRMGLARAINATGIVLHTNLGRAPLAAEAIAAVGEVARSWCNLEFDLESGARGARGAALEPLLAQVTGAEAGLAVNNGAAAILLALSALAGGGVAGGGEVIVSRGELVEIGGGFRVPDVIRQGGARLVEVGATNKTRLGDYRAAITAETRVLLKVHQSNFRQIGFTAEVEIAELAGLAREFGLLVVADLGSGLIAGMPGCDEPTLREALAAGADVVTCSGDKLLGGPQAGLILGRSEVLGQLRRHPLLRAVRLDKMSLAALEATLVLHRDHPEAVPVRRMLASGEGELAARAERLRALVGLSELGCEVVVSAGFAGGGSLPEQRIVSRALALVPAMGVEAAAAALRAGRPAVVGRIAEGRLLLDVLTVADDEIAELAGLVRAMLG